MVISYSLDIDFIHGDIHADRVRIFVSPAFGIHFLVDYSVDYAIYLNDNAMFL